jgi:two-component system, NtrC family, response regulator HydG
MKQQPNILVVDDNKDLLNTFALILKRKGYIVDTAEDGEQALHKYSSHRFDVVLMDAIMPHMGGIEALHRMRENDPAAKIILMTAYCEEDQLQKVIQEGAYCALYKPVNIAKLMELIGELTGDPLILIVDDDDDFRFTMSRMLEMHGYKVSSAISGPDAIRLASQQTFNLAFVDIKMSVMDGLKTSLKLKELNQNMQIVMMTGYRDEVKEIVDQAASQGIFRCLYKPFDISEVKEAVNTVT